MTPTDREWCSPARPPAPYLPDEVDAIRDTLGFYLQDSVVPRLVATIDLLEKRLARAEGVRP